MTHDAPHLSVLEQARRILDFLTETSPLSGETRHLRDSLLQALQKQDTTAAQEGIQECDRFFAGRAEVLQKEMLTALQAGGASKL